MSTTARRLGRRAVISTALLAVAAVAFAQEPPPSPAASGGRQARLAELERLEKAHGAAPADLGLTRQLAEALLLVGESERVIELIDPHLERGPETMARLGLLLGKAQASLGRHELAEETFRAVVAIGGADDLVARVELAEVLLSEGRRAPAEELLYSLIDAYNARAVLSAQELVAVGRACQALGRNDHQLFHDALKAYDEAAAADPTGVEAEIRIGLLFLEKYDSAQGRAALVKALAADGEHPLALLAMAQVQRFDGSAAARELVEKSLEINPALVPARVFLARLLLELEDHQQAEEEALRALDSNPRSLEALSVLAAAHFLQDDAAAFEAVRDRVLQQNPGYAELFNDLAEACVQNRLYREARDFAAKAVALDEKSWRGFGLLGLNQLRLGEIEEGRHNLEASFTGDPYNVWNKNTLDLLDTFGGYRLSLQGRFELFIHEDEAELLAPYIGALAEEAYEALAKRYRHRPPTPIRIEVYPSHEDFSVRTVGLAGLGALGVSFGPVVAIDSPSAREIGRFNWGSTLWHELAHTFTLGVTDHKIPRWLTEGLSVLEERHAREGWGDDVRPEFLQAYRDGRLLGIDEINNGFVRPSFPIQIALSYYQASLVCELIEKEHALAKILELLAGYRAGGATEDLFVEVLGQDLETFDQRFWEHLEERFAPALTAFQKSEEDHSETPVAVPQRPQPTPEELERRADEAPEDFRAQLAWGAQLFEEKEYDRAMPYLERARDLFPDYVGGGSPYRLLAKIFRERSEWERAVEELQELTSRNELDYLAHRQLAESWAALGRDDREAEVLERTLYIYPLEPTVHDRLAELYRSLEDHSRRVRELRATVALDPPSRAEALYQLALALVDAGDRSSARREVLRALELAPGYDEAQRLLLQLIDEASS